MHNVITFSSQKIVDDLADKTKYLSLFNYTPAPQSLLTSQNNRAEVEIYGNDN